MIIHKKALWPGMAIFIISLVRKKKKLYAEMIWNLLKTSVILFRENQCKKNFYFNGLPV